jgi:hypothetical protein
MSEQAISMTREQEKTRFFKVADRLVSGLSEKKNKVSDDHGGGPAPCRHSLRTTRPRSPPRQIFTEVHQNASLILPHCSQEKCIHLP